MDEDLNLPLATNVSQLDRLGEQLRNGERGRQNLFTLATFRNAFIAPTQAVAKKIIDSPRRFDVDVTQRPAKSSASIIAKLQREHSRLTQIQDIGGVRLVVSKTSVQAKAASLVERLFPGSRVIDRRTRPQNGYRAIHIIVRSEDRLVEVQIRTRLQNGWAQYSEKLADIHGNELKYGVGDPTILSSLKYLSEGVDKIENMERMADKMKAGMNELHRLRREQKELSIAQARVLSEYELLRHNIRSVRHEWLSFFKRASNI